MAGEVLNYLDPKEGQSYLDLTAGYGGHAQAVIEITKTPDGAVLVDRDARAVASLKNLFAGQAVRIIQEDFLGAAQRLGQEGTRFDMVLLDLGTSSPHFDQADRGFSIRGSGPLDMRMDQSQELRAADIVNRWPENKIADILRDYGQEPKSRQIARKIIQSRPINSTDKLADIVKQVWWRRSKLHPATKTFQALRIAVNDELNQLKDVLPAVGQLLAPGGRMVIISFHSLEDRIVKKFLQDNCGGYDSDLTILTKKPITPGKNELVSNPRARSAKLRAAAKIKTKERTK